MWHKNCFVLLIFRWLVLNTHAYAHSQHKFVFIFLQTSRKTFRMWYEWHRISCVIFFNYYNLRVYVFHNEHKWFCSVSSETELHIYYIDSQPHWLHTRTKFHTFDDLLGHFYMRLMLWVQVSINIKYGTKKIIRIPPADEIVQNISLLKKRNGSGMRQKNPTTNWSSPAS